MQGFLMNEYFQEYCAIDAETAVVLPKGMDPSISSPIFCAGITGMLAPTRELLTSKPRPTTYILAYHGVLDARINTGDWLAVIGCGGLGQLGISHHIITL